MKPYAKVFNPSLKSGQMYLKHMVNDIELQYSSPDTEIAASIISSLTKIKVLLTQIDEQLARGEKYEDSDLKAQIDEILKET